MAKFGIIWIYKRPNYYKFIKTTADIPDRQRGFTQRTCHTIIYEQNNC
jgi:chromosome condensin MukBEF complex kleisin-like MukF subunit